MKTALTIEYLAEEMGVSTATVRNWIKTGFLIQYENGHISQESFDDFMKNVAGKEKLTSRANKSLKDKHDSEKIKSKLNSLLNSHSGESLGSAYENLLSNAYRNQEGIYYTPSWIVSDMLKSVEIQPNFTFLDPGCGSGNFIIGALKFGIKPENIYGFDTDENAILITTNRVKKEFGIELPQLKQGDFLVESHKLKQNKLSFDLIFTNPPWGKKKISTEKEKVSTIYNSGSSLDTTSLFLAASLHILKQGGILGFLMQEAFFNIGTFEDIRSRVLRKEILHLIDYGKAFKGLITGAQAIVLKNQKPTPTSKIRCSYQNKKYERSLKSFENNPKKILNFWANEQDAKVIEKLFSHKHITLDGRAKWALGIVTGNNQKFCKSEPTKGYLPIYKGSDITKNGLKETTTFITKEFTKLQQCAPLEMYQAKEKLIYKFISSKLCFYYDNQQKLILNSANLLIPYDIDISMKQLSDLLNSEVINWLFQKIFSTHKILRSDLEQLPIHTEYFKHYNDFSEETYLSYLQLEKTGKNNFKIKS